ncbi:MULTISPECIES: GNAT family N-acetyltransferase [Bacillus]|uniref:GNAT family N-acetyltransferase n=1 Tax=Bacillus TaxID=1386 RepID=UPI00066FF20C|nr:GNAT family N-acetyltransferase [Bacillus sp. JFL15]
MVAALSFYKPEHADGLNGFVLSEEDKMFTALPKDVLPQALVIRERYPTVVLKEDTPVGFFILHTSKETIAPYSNSVSAILLSALSIDARQQGKGYAKQAMLQLPAFAASYFPWCDEIVLAVNHRNHRAKNLYQSSGFIDKGRRRIGPIGEQHILHLFL